MNENHQRNPYLVDPVARLNALTRERDEAVRVAAELRALAEKMAPHIIAFRTATDVIHAGGIGRHSIAKADQCSICYLRAEVDATLDALAHGGTKPQGEPMNQKEHGS